MKQCCPPGSACTGICTRMSSSTLGVCSIHGSYAGLGCPACSSNAAGGTSGIKWNGYCSEHGFWYGNECPGCANRRLAIGGVPVTIMWPPAGYRLVPEEKLRRLERLVDEVVELATELLPY